MTVTERTSERRKLKKYRGLVDDGRMSLEDAKTSFKSWYGSYEKLYIMNYLQNTFGALLFVWRKEEKHG